MALIAPVPPDLSIVAQPTLWPELTAEPFERRVTRVLAHALDSAKGALSEFNRGRGQSAFDAAIKYGVSANLCEAVAALSERSEGSDISLMWAKTRPTPEASRRFWFSKDDGAVLKEAARQFRLKEPRDGVTILGIIERCTREIGHSSGRISIAALIDDRAQKVTAHLERGDYERAVQAHGKRKAITITGELRQEGQRWRLHNPRDLTVVAENNDDDDDDDETSSS